MARIIKRICFMTIVFLVAISIKVYANELTIDCQDSINPETENTLECVLKGNFTDNVNSIKVRYTIPDGVEFQGFTPSDEWNLEQGGTATTTGLVLRIDNGDVNGQVEFGKFTFSVPSTYNKNKITFKIYELDATNTSCEIVEFNKDEVSKSVQIEGKNDNDPNETQDEENKNPSDDSNKNNGNNNSNTPSDSKDDKNKSDNDVNSDKNSTSEGSKNSNNDLNPKYNTEKDTTVTKTPFGQYGNRNIIIVLIVIVSFAGFVGYKKFKKVKFIK